MTHDRLPLTDGLEITLHHGGEGSIVRLRGCLNIDSSPALRDHLLSMLGAQSAEAVIVDLTDVSYIDSSGIATLIEGLRIARMRQTTFCVQGLHDRLLHLFQVTGMSTLFKTNDCRSDSSKVS
jgi:anti-sigma B factor antagonist